MLMSWVGGWPPEASETSTLLLALWQQIQVYPHKRTRLQLSPCSEYGYLRIATLV
jgi:hypothetical protein